MVKPTIALSEGFLEAYSRIPSAQQKKVREFTQKFRDNPTSAAINFEKIHGVKDDKVRTVRIDQKYRAVVLQPEQGNVYMLAWVDNHDEAMAWAKNKVFEINPSTGALQIVNVSEVARELGEKKKARCRLFDETDDQTLLSLGVPSILLPAIRAVADKNGLLDLAKHLPAEAAEGLTWLSEGIPPSEIKDYLAQTKSPKQIDTTDFAAALDNPDSRRRFVKISTESDLDKVLDAPLEKWRIFLHPSQEELVRTHFNGPARVLGGAGTGKTVVAMHRTRYLAQNVFNGEKDRILFTTFTANLAKNVSRNLKRLCDKEFARIEVANLHVVAARILKDHGITFKIAEEDDLQLVWDDALLSEDQLHWEVGFVSQEWEQIVQANGIETEADYLKVPRTGRGKTLSRLQRAQLWKVFHRFAESLQSRGLREWLGMIRETRRLVESEKVRPYRAVVVDEAQDFHPEEWKLIRALAPTGPNDLFIVGDAHQRIYGRKVTLSRCGIQIQGRSRKLRINYRTTEQIRAWADAMLAGMDVDDLDGSSDRDDGYKSLLSGPVPQIEKFKTADEERQFLEKTLPDLIARHGLESVCMVARTNKALKEYVPIFRKLKLAHVILDKTADEGESGVRLATMHRVKGLEFPCMILAGVNAKVMPLSVGSAAADPVIKAEHESKEKSLLFVAATRARDKLLITTFGTPSHFLERITNE